MNTPDYKQAFLNLLEIMTEEHLIRWRKRAQMNHMPDLELLFTDEIEKRKLEGKI